MATAVVMPKQGQSVESTIIVEWKVQPGATVAEGDILCEVETDKAVMEVPSPVAGTLLATFFQPGDLVPVLVNIAAIGAPGEDVTSLRPAEATTTPAPDSPQSHEATKDMESADASADTGRSESKIQNPKSKVRSRRAPATSPRPSTLRPVRWLAAVPVAV